MHYTVLLFIISWVTTVAGALSVSLSSGTTRASEPLNITWRHDKHEKVPFFLEKIKLDEPGGPGSPMVVDIANSSADVGASSIEFNRTGLFAVIAVNAQTNQSLFTTEINVVSATSSSVPAPTSSTTTTMSNSTSNMTKNHVAASAVAGGVAGGITGLVLLSITFILCWRRNRHRKASLQIPYPFYDESKGSETGALVSRGIKPAEPGVQTPQQSGVGETSRMATMSRIEEEQPAAWQSENSVYINDGDEAAIDIDGSVTEVSEQPPAYTSEC
ncbi:hypothetical protein BDP27DRAFT_1448818 [Rhodocollybia butyracea]|uniref:Mid2 domain-containing protein n=1 Tax=Rhodocollybia butyracea TaxID=206335 RepID=A0A9P5U7F2_9AGAR|nr:hypothetical protein BDP27DRAFT_1448818 [Rhodocollybia butyracea]